MRSRAEQKRLCVELLRIGESGGEPRDWLEDEDPGVRGCAALAPALASDRAATEVLRRLASSARVFDCALGYGGDSPALRYFVGPPRWTLAEVVCARVDDPGRISEAAHAALQRAFRRSPCPELSPYIRVAFPGGWPRAEAITSAQQTIARGLTARSELWQGNAEHRVATLRPLGLPDDWAAWHKLAQSAMPDDPGPADILVIEDPLQAVRTGPQLYVDAAGRSDPRLPGAIVTQLVEEFARCHGTDESARWNLTIESRGRFVLEVDGMALSAEWAPRRRSYLTTVLTFPQGARAPEWRISVAAAFCAGVLGRTWYGGRAFEQEVVDLRPLHPPTPAGEMHGTGYRIEFDLDMEWLPPGSAIPLGLDAHPRVHDLRSARPQR
ncbi:hypothetical protein O7635_01810 [Asanoa sp. WMMD1127]|uniref:hypothetical protein n=1 Tax=Asanoa sp. WMMD1127 TaxID=3016107 RepID=UPI00241603EA|nr:hypothetical protein [Asanoa sp. WMMD1127]MDG4820586.1 hypothetical protein [Asanoa sp. WMMD1127]